MRTATKDRGGVRHIPFNRDERSGDGFPPEEILQPDRKRSKHNTLRPFTKSLLCAA